MNASTVINRRIGRQFLFLAVAGIIAGSALAQELEAASIDVFRLFMGLFGGLALFLFGIDQMSQGLKAVAGDRMATFRMEDEVIDALRRIYRLTRRLAKLLLPAVVANRET